MFFKKTSFKRSSCRLKWLPAELINVPSPPPFYSDESVEALSASISSLGMINPLTVTKNGRAWHLVCGRRRLAAAKACGMKSVPCIVIRGSEHLSGHVMAAENLQRHEPDFLEKAQYLRYLTRDMRIPLNEAAVISGVPEKSLVSHLRVLRLSRRILFGIRDSGLSLRHALALLKIASEPIREAALCEMAFNDMGPEAAERYVDGLLKLRSPEEVPGVRSTYIIKDVRMFLNSVRHGVEMMSGAGIDVECSREDSDNCVKLTIRIPCALVTAPKAG